MKEAEYNEGKGQKILKDKNMKEGKKICKKEKNTSNSRKINRKEKIMREEEKILKA